MREIIQMDLRVLKLYIEDDEGKRVKGHEVKKKSRAMENVKLCEWSVQHLRIIGSRIPAIMTTRQHSNETL